MDVKKLYAKAAVLGMVEPGSHEDAFHQLVYGMTGKESVKALTEPEFQKVENELKQRLHARPSDRRPEPQEAPGMMTKAQRDMAWRQIYTLAALSPSRASAGERMAGAVGKILGITASPKEPLKWVSKEDGSRLIDTLKRYVRTAQKKKVKQGESG